jgi:polyisoprenoid-binding protein YceI
MPPRPRRVLAGFLLLALPQLTAAAMPLDPESSEVHFVSIKQDHMAEAHHFGKLEGRLYDSGKAVVNVDLASVATGLGVRDRRMRRELFRVARNPQATLQADVAMAALRKLQPGETLRRRIEARLTLNGRTQPVQARAQIIRRPGGGFRVTSLSPVLLDVRNFGLAPGVAVLRRMAGLDHISFAVPVTFSLAFTGSGTP